MRSIVLASLLAALAMPCVAHAEDGKFDASLELRARVEAIDGQFRPGIVDSNIALLTRVLAFAEYDAGPIRIGGEVIDARSFFERTRSSVSTTEVDTLEPIQAYVSTDFSDVAKLTAGRFTLNLGSRRLIARNGFRNTINSYTGAHLDLGGKDRGATVFWMIPQTRLPDEIHRIRDDAFALDRERGGPPLFGAFVHDTLRGTIVETYLYRLAENDSPGILTRDRHLWTLGGRALRAPAPGHIDYEIEAAAQWGHVRQTSAATDRLDRAARAGFVHASTGYTFMTDWHPRVALAFDAGTGDGPGDRYTRFDPLYSSRGFDFGPTSYYGPLTRANLISPEVRFEAKPGKNTEAMTAVRPLWLDSLTDQFAVTGIRDAAGSAGRYAGTQIEARVRQTLVPDHLRLGVGGAMIFKGRFLEEAANAPDTGDTHYGFVELTATF